MELEKGWVIYWAWDTTSQAVRCPVIDVLPRDTPVEWVEAYLRRVYDRHTSTLSELVGLAAYPDEKNPVPLKYPREGWMQAGNNQRLVAREVRDIEVEGTEQDEVEIISWEEPQGAGEWRRIEITQRKDCHYVD